jgi:hypothetical protein
MLWHVIGTNQTRATNKFLENEPEDRRKVGRDQRYRERFMMAESDKIQAKVKE